MSAIDEITAERQRQTERWSACHDDEHTNGELGIAAGCYALSGSGRWSKDALREIWPKTWSTLWWKPKNNRRDLIKAAALIVAEIERLDRLTQEPT